MALEEIPGNGGGVIEFTRNGATAHREFICDWDEAAWISPKPGESHPDWPLLTVDKVRLEPLSTPHEDGFGRGYTEQRKVIVDYSLDYRRLTRGDPPRVTYTGGTEVLQTADGRVWDDINVTIDVEDASGAEVYPTLTYRIDMAVDDIPIDNITNLLGKINDAEFQGASAGSMLFTSFDATAEFDYEYSEWFFRVTYNFLWRNHSHNEVWRHPQREWDATNNDWKRDADGKYVYKAGTAGQGAWTTTTPVIYEEADFSVLLT